VLTQHNDLTRDGANPNETILTTSNVNVNSFGLLFSLPVDGLVFAQPLYVPGVAIHGQGSHNILYVATEHNSVFAFDADKGTKYWQVSLGTSVPASVTGEVAIQTEIGITSTPAIDPGTGTLYVMANTYESGTQIYRLHALNIANGAEKFGGPVQISASVSGSGAESSNGSVPFDAAQELQRPAVTLVNGIVYLAFGSHDDIDPYHGWVLGYDASSLKQVQAFITTPNGGEGAVWMAGQGLVADSSNNLYLVTGNSTQNTENATGDFGESFLKLVPNGNSLTVGDYFKSMSYDYLNATDGDLGSAGAFSIPGTSYIGGGGKQGIFYLVDTSNMGGLNLSADQVVQEFQANNGIYNSPVFFNNTMYIWGASGPLLAYQFTGGQFNVSPSSQSAYSSPPGQTSAALSLSSNGNTPGTAIVWATSPSADPSTTSIGGNLYAYDASNLSNLLWSSLQNASRDSYGDYAKFVPPTVVNGKVYVATDSQQVVAYGLLAPPAPTAIPDFAISIDAASATAVPGGAAAFQFTVTPVNVSAFQTNLTLAASGLPPGATYSFSPASIAAGAGATAITLTINVPQTQASARPGFTNAGGNLADKGSGGLASGLSSLSFALLLLPFAGRLRRMGNGLSRRLSVLLLSVAAMAAVAGISGCGSQVDASARPAVDYTVTITATSGTLTHSATVTLTVN